ncbi:MAG TPA: ATP-binding protein [Vicinamibacterales bacterium]
MLNTIRARLTLWYASVLTGVLVAFSLGIYVLLSRALDLRVDANLQSIINIARTSLTHDAQEGQTREDAARTTVDELSGPLQGLAIFDEDGTLLAAGGWDDFMPRLPAAPSERFQVYTVPEDDDDDEHLRIATQRVLIPASKTGYVILAGQSLEPIEDELESLRDILLYVVPIAVVVAGLGGWAIARQSLAPVAAMSAQARSITASALGARLPVVNPTDELGGLAQTFNDLLQRLEESFATQRQFMADASHELRTPIATSRTAVGVTLKRPHRDEAEYREALRIVEDQTTRLTRIVDDMLTLARADAGEYPLRVISFYLDELVQDAARGARVLARSSARVEVSAPVETPFSGDEDLLRRMLLNLIDNALQHVPPDGEIKIALERSDSAVRITVADNGPGIPIEAQAHIFERFYRADRARSRRDASEGTGAGLGLAIAKWIAEAHQGRLELVRSSAQGTTFQAVFPAPPRA